MEFFTALKDTPLPTILVIGGIIFLFLGIATIKKPIVIDVTPSSRRTALFVGVVLIGGGIYLLVQPNPGNSMAIETTTPAVLPSDTPIVPTFTVVPLASATTDLTRNLKNIVITEVLGNPCGADSRNELIELYNSGNIDIDTAGLWITDGEQADSVIPWETRYSGVNLGAVTNTSIIPARGFALILAPGYPFVDSDRIMPYRFPSTTVIFTVADGQLLGDEDDGIEVTNRDPIVLYQGDGNNIQTVISTYGSPILSNSPLTIKDDGLDKIPFSASSLDCWSVQRIIPTNEDIESNWKVTEKSSPGTGDYP